MNPAIQSILSPLRWLFRLFKRPNRAIHEFLDLATALAALETPHPGLQNRSRLSQPLISLVVPVYNTRVSYLDDLLRSFDAQIIAGRTENLFELVLSDDGSRSAETLAWLANIKHRSDIRVLINGVNRGIAGATNAGIAAASGEWIALLDHDDAIAPFALEQIGRALVDHPDCRFLYTDELITDENLHPIGTFLKPAFDEVLLSGVNYINHFSVYRRDRLMSLGCLREGFQGSQDFDLLLRYTAELQPNDILHLPYPAYLWRRDGQSFSAIHMERSTIHARKALAERFPDAKGTPSVSGALDPNLHRLNWAGSGHVWPKVSIIIPSRDSLSLIRRVMDGLLKQTDYPDFEIIVVDNGSTDPEVLELYRQWAEGPVSFRADIRPEPFNFSRAINRGVAQATGDVLLLLNNDIEVLDRGWLKEMVSCLHYSRTGIVGAKLLYPDQKIQHVGVIAGLGGYAGHWFIGEKRDYPGPMGRLNVRQSLSVVTGACFLISRSCWDAIGPFDEERFAIAYNDVDFCLRAVEAEYRVIWTPFAELVHHESASRGSDETLANIDRFNREKANLKARHQTDCYEDRAFNPWYTKGHSVPGLAKLDALPKPRH